MKTNYYKKISWMSTKLIGLFLIGIMFITSCRGDDEAKGPMGNANVQLFTVDNPTWSGSSIYFDHAAITQEVVDNAAILTYMVFEIYPELSYHVPGIGPDNTYQIRVFSEVGSVTFTIADVDGSPFSGTVPPVLKLKIIVIPSNTSGIAAKMPTSAIENELKNAGVDINDYEAVKQYYNIVE